MPQDQLQRAKECYADVKEAWRENHQRMLEDLKFSNPADPQQWEQDVLNARKGRVCLTLDRTNQYIVQVVNDGRKNKPAMTTMPVDSRGDVAVAQSLDGVIRHIEYRSRAQIAYDWALEGAARCGVGWIRPVPKVIEASTNQQEICIQRVVDHLSIVIDGTEPDGSDAMNGFAETLIPRKQFQKEFPKASTTSWASEDGAWIIGDQVRVCEHQYVVESMTNMLSIENPDGDRFDVSEDDYWTLAKQIGYQPRVVAQFAATSRTVKWCKFNGSELLEETTYPGRWIGMVPVIGFEAYVDGKRYLCGVTRRLMPSQRAYNYERSALVEAVAVQPKAPALVPAEGIEGHEEHWQTLNKGQPAYLPYNALDAEGKPLPLPQRLAPPTFPTAFAQGGQLAVSDMEAGIGMYRANLGAPSNETSGRAIRERKQEGDTATFHFIDNLSRSIEHLGRIVVGQIPLIYDTKRQAKILGQDGQQGEVTIDPDMPQAAQKRGTKVVAINPGVGTYDVRVVAGPSYTTQREEAADGVEEALRAAPQFAPVLIPTLVKMRDWPDAEKVSRMLMAMAPPEVQAIANEGQEEAEQPVPPEVQSQLQQMQQEMQQMAQMLDAGEAELQRLQAENEQLKTDKTIDAAKVRADATAAAEKNAVEQFKAETDRLAVVLSAAPTEGEGVPASAAPVAEQQPAVPPAPPVQIVMPDLMPQAEAMNAIAQRQEELEATVEMLAKAVAAPRRAIPKRDPATGLITEVISIPATEG